MAARIEQPGRLPSAFTMPGVSSFTEFLASASPELLPGSGSALAAELAPHGTTIVAAQCAGGVVMAGDRRATRGNLIASRATQKVFLSDAYSMVGIAGTLGTAVELVRLYCLELEHYEKIEGTSLSLAGKANRLATMIHGNLGAAFQGLVVQPLFAGYDIEADPAEDNVGRIFSYDITGGCFEEEHYDAVGSGSLFAKAALKKRYEPGLPAEQVMRLCVEALYDAADDDSATGGPDLARRIYPVITLADAEGARQLSEDEAGTLVMRVVEGRMANPGG